MWWDFICKNAWRDRYHKAQDALDECRDHRNALCDALIECNEALDKCNDENKKMRREIK